MDASNVGGHGWLSLGMATFPLSRILANAHGAVLVTVDGGAPRALAFDGRRTRDGDFTARAAGKDSSRAESGWLMAKPTTLPLSDTRGLYDASCRTEAYSASVRKQIYVDWKGVAAVATNGGKIFIYLRLWNDMGGSTGIFGDAPLADDGSFSMDRGESVTNLVVLAGHVTPGEIVARWRDRRTSESEVQCEIALTRK